MLKKIISIALVSVLCLGTFASCGKTEPEKPEVPVPASTLTVGYSQLTGQYNPFFADTEASKDAVKLTQASLLTVDRAGDVVTGAVKGEKRSYNGTEYSYSGVADTDIKVNPDGSAVYTFTLSDSVTFSDGEPMTADDLIFSLYVLADPTYDGQLAFNTLPVTGMADYISGMVSRGSAIHAAGNEGYLQTGLFTKEQYNAFWDYYNNQAGIDMANDIIACCAANGYNTAEDSVAECARSWGYELDEKAEAKDFWDAMVAENGSIEEASANENAGNDLTALTVKALGSEYSAGVDNGKKVKDITGIKKLDEHTVAVTTDTFSTAAIYQFDIPVVPMHRYGETEKYNYDESMFGFNKGDLSHIREAEPLGAGAYKLTEVSEDKVTFERNADYYKGLPETGRVVFKLLSEEEKLEAAAKGEIDISSHSYNKEDTEKIAKLNGGKSDKQVISVLPYSTPGHGYIGINASTVNINGVADSKESKALRKAFATIFSAYREDAVENYYGDSAAVVDYPISTASWASPQLTDDDGGPAFSVNPKGKKFYDRDDDPQTRHARAKKTALEFFKAAGYTVKDNKVTAAPEGGRLSFNAIVPAGGKGDHPCFYILTYARAMLSTMGITLKVTDVADSTQLWNALDENTHEIWCSAWGEDTDPDLYKIYHSANILGVEASADSNHYHIWDEELDKCLEDARQTADSAERRELYARCFEIIADWAVEVPVFEKRACLVYETAGIDPQTFPGDITYYYGWINEAESIKVK